MSSRAGRRTPLLVMRNFVVGALFLVLAAALATAQVTINNGSDLGTWSIGSVQTELDASGGNGTYSWSLASGSLPPGIALRTDLPPWFSPNASAGLIGVATTPGTYSFSLAVTSGGSTATQSFTVKVTLLAIKDIYQLPDAFVSSVYSYKFTALNNQGTPVWSATGLPPGLSMGSDGTVSGTPTQSGYYNPTITLSDGVDTISWGHGLAVFDVQITTDGTLPNTTQDGQYNATITASGGTPPYTFTSNGLPGNLVLASDGTITGSISSGPGVYRFNITATDSNHLSYSKQMSIDVVGQPAALPQISVYSEFNVFNDCTFGTDCGETVGVNSGTAPYTWTASGLPSGMDVRDGSAWNNPGTAQIWGHPTQLGDYNVTVTVTDAAGSSATQTFPLHVSEMLRADGFQNGTVGVPYSYKARIIGGTGPYSVNPIKLRLPDGLTFDPATFLLSGTPHEDGGYNMLLQFSDSAGHTLRTENYFGIGYSNTGSQTLSIGNNGDLGTITVGDGYNNQLNACCAPSYVWTLYSAPSTLPPGITLSTGGVLSGVATTPGTYNFTVQVADASNNANSALRYFTLTVSPIRNTTPGPLPFGNVGTPYSFTFTASGGTGSLTWSLPLGQYLPPGLSLSLGGVLSGTPTASGQYSGVVYVTDTAGNVTSVYFDISIYPAGANPPLDLPLGPDLGTPMLGRVYYQLQATGGMPPYHYSLTPGAGVIPGMRVQDGQPLPQWFQPQATGGFIGLITAPGPYSTSIRVTDSAGKTFDRAVHFTVTDLQYAGQNPPNGTVSVPYSYTLQGIGGSGNYSFTDNGGLPPGLSLSSSGVVSGTPSTPGTYNVSFVLTDLSNGERSYFGFQIVIDPFAITTGGILPSGAVNVPYNQQLSAPDCGTGCTWTLNGGLPGNVSLSPSGTLSGTPNWVGNFTFQVQASGSSGTVQKNFFWQVISSPPQQLFINMPSDFGIVPFANGWVFPLMAQGGTAPYSWAITSGSLPAGMTLYPAADQAGPVNAWWANPGYAVISGPARQLGQFSFTLQVTDANNKTASEAFTLEVSPIGFEYYGLPIPGNPLVYNKPYTQPLLAVGGDSNYTWTAVDSVPTGLNLAPNGTVTGTPAVTGGYGSQIRVTDGQGNYYQWGIGFNIDSGTAQTLGFNSGPNLGVWQQGYEPNIFLNPAGGVGPYTVTVVDSLPSGMVLLTDSNQPATGVAANNFILTGTLMPGTYNFTIQLHDTQGNVGARTFSLTVAPFTLFNNTNLADGSVGVPYSVPLVAFDNSGSPVWSVAAGFSLPPGLSLSSAGLISGTPSQAGQFSFQVTATAGGATITYTVNVHISALAITDSEVLPDGAVGVPYSYSFAAAGTAGVTWSATGLPGGLHMSTSGVISGTPGGVARANVYVTASSSTDRVREHFVLYVTEPNPTELSMPTANLVPSASGESFPDAVLGQTYQVALVPGGGTPPYTFTVGSGSSLPPGLALYSGAQLQSIQNGRVPGVTVLAGVPSVAGTYSFSLVLTDAAGRQTNGTFTLKVVGLNVLPNPNGFPAGIRNLSSGVPFSQQFSVVGGTPPYTFSVSSTNLFTLTLPAGLTMASSGLLSGTPSDTGDFGFVLHVSDATGQTFSATYYFSVQNQKGLEVYAGPLYDQYVGSGTLQCLTTNGSSTYSWSVVSGAIPPGIQLLEDDADCGPNTWALAGAATNAGTYNFTLRATDTADSTNFADQALTFRIAPFQTTTVSPGFVEVAGGGGQLPLPIGVVGSPYSFTMRVAGGATPYSVAESPFYPLPPGLTLSSSGVLSGTPLASGVFNVTPVVTDSNGNTANAFPMPLVITSAGSVAPLVSGLYPNTTLDNASVGVPYHANLDALFTWHRAFATQSWSVTSGSNLPPGMALMPGHNGVPSYLGGTPTTPGIYNFQLTAADSTGQSLTFNVSLDVNVLALSPDSIRPAVVGSSYSVSLVPSGGTAPYTLALTPYSDLPVGLSLNSSGVLAGVPTSAGNFFIFVTLTDANGNTLNKVFPIVVDDPAGEAPAVSLSPKPIQVLYTIGSAALVTVPVNVGSTTSGYAFTLAESGLSSANLSANSGTTPATVNLSIDTTGLAPGTYSGLIGVAAPQTVNEFDTVPVQLTVVQPPPCTYSLTPSANSLSSIGGTGSFSVATGSSCSWTATVSDSSWISITTGCAVGHVCPSHSSTGSGTLAYNVQPNLSASPRTGSITVNGSIYTITEFAATGCSFGISPANLQVSAGGGIASIAVTASSSSCSWTASGLGATPASGTGNGSVSLTIPPNGTAQTQMLTATVAGQTFTATESGANCTASLSASDASWPANGGSGSVTISAPAGCSYSTVTGPSWITVTSGASGTSAGTPITLLYTVDPNSTTQARSGALTIGGQPFQISEVGAACSVSIDSSQLGSPFGPGGGSGVVGITTNGTGCSWSAQTGDSWVTVAPASGTGAGTIGVTVASNASSPSGRTTSIVINGQSVNISQSGTTCSYALQSSSGMAPADGGSGLVGVIAPAACSWTSSSNNPDWLTIASSGSGGSADVQFVAQPNTNSAPRSGSLNVAGLTYTVTQQGAPCAYTLSSSNVNVASSGLNAGTFTFTTAASGCSPNVVSYSNWIGVTTTFTGSSGTVTYTVAANPSGANRQGTVQVGDQSFTITESAAACAYSLNAYGEVVDRNGKSSDQLLGSPNALGCTPVTGTDQPTFIHLGTLSGPANDIFTQKFTVDPFNSATPNLRFGNITFGGQIFAIKQTSW